MSAPTKQTTNVVCASKGHHSERNDKDPTLYIYVDKLLLHMVQRP